ncbi:MAG TPA: potassium channel family protein [Acidimicrobiia bacterium]|nr:potassium channel family protein [Acidimicrobiia bacterium]
MAYDSRTTPTGVERWLEERMPGYQFGYVLMLLFITFVFMASGIQGPWSRVVTVTLQGLTLLAALLAARTGRRLFRVAAVVVLVALVSTIGSAIVDTNDNITGVFFLLNVLLVGAAPVVIGTALWRRQVVDIHTVLGAICIYVLIGMMFAFVYSSIGLIGDQAFFVQTNNANIADFLYFAFITLTTVGYGDFTAAHGLGRALASLEALLGQLYLVTVVAVLVSRMARRSPGDGSVDTSPDTGPPTPAA